MDTRELIERDARKVLADYYRAGGNGGMADDIMRDNWRVGSSPAEMDIVRAIADALSSQAAEIERLREALSTNAARDVLAERQRQVKAEGWTAEHDDQHSGGELALAAACYANPLPLADVRDRLSSNGTRVPKYWPFDDDWWKPAYHLAPDRDRRNLVKAGALILAEIERLDRAALPPKPNKEGE